MKKYFIIFLLLLSGCTTIIDGMDPSAAAVRYGCTYSEAHFDNNGNYIPSGYGCPSNTPNSYLESNSCTWVNSYYRKDGTYVSGHSRCSKVPRYSSYSSTKTGSSCHYVSGYYRKNGTYVRGYTSCR